MIGTAKKRIAEAIESRAEKLDLSKCELTEIPLEVGEMVWLKELNCSDNQIKEIESLEKLGKLWTLNLENNQIQEIYGLENLIGLRELSLGFNKLDTIRGLETLKNLLILYLDSNKLERIEGLDGLENLLKLSLIDNSLDTIHGIKALKSLKELNLKNNSIQCIENLGTAKNLELLDLSNNKIKKIERLETLRNLQSLYLENNLISEINGLLKLKNLQYLSLSQNQIKEIKNLQRLKKLRNLTLSRNLIKHISGLDSLGKLELLYLEYNQIKEIRGIDSLKNLITLHLGGNQFKRIKGLEKLKNLQTLKIANNQISDVEGLKNLEQILNLDLSNNLLREVNAIEKLEKLQYLYVSGNEIVKIDFLDNLRELLWLDLSGNQFKEMPTLGGLNKLLYLNLGNNKIVRIDNKAYPQNLQFLGLNNNPLKKIPTIPYELLSKLPVLDFSSTDIENLVELTPLILQDQQVLWSSPPIGTIKNSEYQSREWGIFVKDCTRLKMPAKEWIVLGPKIVKQYFLALDDQGYIEMNEAKVLLVGDGGVGKTSLAYRLTRPKSKLPTEENRTKGIDIFNWKYQRNKKTFLIHIWDFGGQVMYNMIHQYFYSKRSLYVLLDSSRSGANEFDSRLNQILQSVELFGGDESSMVMIQNLHSGHKKNLNFKKLQENYTFLNEYHTTNLSTREGIRDVIDSLKRFIEDIPGLGQIMPNAWMKIRENIETLPNDQSILLLSDYQKICKKNGIEDENAQNTLSLYFHQLGIFQRFQENTGSLRNFIILNRKWLLKACYKVFDSDLVRNSNPPGSFVYEDFVKLWPEEEFVDFYPQLIELMKEFGICFELKSSKKFLVPSLMSKMPDKDFLESFEKPLRLFYDYKYMPEGLLNSLSVQFHKIIGGLDHELVWSDGVVFQEDERLAELREIREPNLSRIQIRIVGPGSYWMSEAIIMRIDEINEKFNPKRLEVKTLIECICNDCQNNDNPHLWNYQVLKQKVRNPDPKFHTLQCPKTHEFIELHNLLRTIIPKLQNENLDSKTTSLYENPEVKKSEDEISFNVKGPKAIEIVDNLITKRNHLINTEHNSKRELVFDPRHLRGLMGGWIIAIVSAFTCWYFEISRPFTSLVFVVIGGIMTYRAFFRESKYYRQARRGLSYGLGLATVLNSLPAISGMFGLMAEGDEGSMYFLGNFFLEDQPIITGILIVGSFIYSGFLIYMDSKKK